MRIYLTIVLSLQLLIAASVSLAGPRSGVMPSKFSMAINGFMGSAHGVLLQDGVLVYTQYGLNGAKKRRRPRPRRINGDDSARRSMRSSSGSGSATYPNPGGWLTALTGRSS